MKKFENHCQIQLIVSSEKLTVPPYARAVLLIIWFSSNERPFFSSFRYMIAGLDDDDDEIQSGSTQYHAMGVFGYVIIFTRT